MIGDSLSFSSEHPFVKLLRDHRKDNEADLVLRGVLTLLFVEDCEINDSGAKIFAQFLKRNATVRTVYLFGCNIGLEGVKAVAEALKLNQTVETLGFEFAGVEDQGAEVLINALNYNVCITTLIVDHNKIASQSMSVLKYLTTTRNETLIPSAVRRASICLISARRTIADAGILAIFPKEIVKMIAMEVWATRKDSEWIAGLLESERERLKIK